MTPTAIKETLAARGLSPLHRFGQNFLAEPLILDRIVEAAEVNEHDRVLEVGPGLGGLTERLLNRGAEVVAVEIDRGFVAHLTDLFGERPGLQLIHTDVLEGKSSISSAVLSAWHGSGSAVKRVVANLPYQVSSAFLAGLVRPSALPWRRAVVTLQKEVGDVLRARPGDENYSPLAFLSAVCFDVRVLRELGPECFVPRPSVRSVVVAIDPAPGMSEVTEGALAFARAIFATRRKALRGTLSRAAAGVGRPLRERPEAILERVGIRPEDRVDVVAPQVLLSLYAALDP